MDFVCCDNPTATKFTIHILAAVAEFERDTISKRTKQALAAAKAKGKVLGNYERIAKAKRDASKARAVLQSSRHYTYQREPLPTSSIVVALRMRAANHGRQYRSIGAAIASAFDGDCFLGVAICAAGSEPV